MIGLGFPVFSKKTGSNRTGKNKNKTLYIKGLGFPVFSKKKPDQTEPDRFGLNRFPVRFG
jgi:hypothetical protein